MVGGGRHGAPKTGAATFSVKYEGKVLGKENVIDVNPGPVDVTESKLKCPQKGRAGDAFTCAVEARDRSRSPTGLTSDVLGFGFVASRVVKPFE